MEENKHEIDITPHVSLMPKLGNSGYSIAEAIAELVENSIDARIDDNLVVEVVFSEDTIEVSDNGAGMDKETVKKALTLAVSEKQGKEGMLGEFGLGLKTACMSLGGCFTLITKAQDSHEEILAVFDEEDFLQSNNWKLQTIGFRVVNNEDHYTKVSIEKFKVSPITIKHASTNIRNELAERFAAYLQQGIIITVNGRKCNPPERKLYTDKEDAVIYTDDGKVLHGWYGFLRKRKTQGRYGFDLFKNGRLITHHAKIGFAMHPENARIVGELHLDHVPVTHNKREFIKESREYALAVRAIGRYVDEKKIKQRSRELGKHERARIASENRILSRLSMFSTLKQPRQQPKSREELEEHALRFTDSDAGISIRSFNYGGRPYPFVHYLQSFESDSLGFSILRDGVLHIFTNLSCPLIENSKEYAAYSLMNTVLCLSEYVSKSSNLPQRSVYEELSLRIASEILTEKENQKVREEIKRLEKRKKNLQEQLKQG